MNKMNKDSYGKVIENDLYAPLRPWWVRQVWYVRKSFSDCWEPLRAFRRNGRVVFDESVEVTSVVEAMRSRGVEVTMPSDEDQDDSPTLVDDDSVDDKPAGLTPGTIFWKDTTMLFFVVLECLLHTVFAVITLPLLLAGRVVGVVVGTLSALAFLGSAGSFVLATPVEGMFASKMSTLDFYHLEAEPAAFAYRSVRKRVGNFILALAVAVGLIVDVFVSISVSKTDLVHVLPVNIIVSGLIIVLFVYTYVAWDDEMSAFTNNVNELSRRVGRLAMAIQADTEVVADMSCMAGASTPMSDGLAGTEVELIASDSRHDHLLPEIRQASDELKALPPDEREVRIDGILEEHYAGVYSGTISGEQCLTLCAVIQAQKLVTHDSLVRYLRANVPACIMRYALAALDVRAKNKAKRLCKRVTTSRKGGS